MYGKGKWVAQKAVVVRGEKGKKKRAKLSA